MNKTILLSCHEAPYYGGAATFHYLLFEYLQKLGYKAHYLTLGRKKEIEFYEKNFGVDWYNPSKLDNVHRCVSTNFNRKEQSGLAEIATKINPDLIIGKNDIAPRLLKIAMPEIETWFLSSSSKQILKNYTNGNIMSLTNGIERLANSNGKLPLCSLKERQAVKLSDRIICDSEITRLCFEYFYPHYRNKIFDRVFWSAPLFKRKFAGMNSGIKKFNSRSIDLLFVASNWSRDVKNYDMVKKIIRRIRHLNIHLVGICKDKLPGVRYHALVDYDKVNRLMGESKTIVSTSLYDSSPNILFEASFLGCNIVASKNCGNWRLCNCDLLVSPYNLENFEEKIRLSLTRRFDDNMHYFLENDPLDQFISLIDRTL